MFGLSSSMIVKSAATYLHEQFPLFRISIARYDIYSIHSLKRYRDLSLNFSQQKYSLEYYLSKSHIVKNISLKNDRSIFEIIGKENFNDEASPWEICLRVMKIVAEHDVSKRVSDEEFVPYCENIAKIIYKGRDVSRLKATTTTLL